MKHKHNLVVAILMLKRGSILPIDLQTSLMIDGIDVAALTNKYLP